MKAEKTNRKKVKGIDLMKQVYNSNQIAMDASENGALNTTKTFSAEREMF